MEIKSGDQREAGAVLFLFIDRIHSLRLRDQKITLFYMQMSKSGDTSVIKVLTNNCVPA